MTLKKTAFAVVGVAVVLLTGCDSGRKSTPAAKETPAASQLETGRFALQKMFVPAHMWSPDAQPIRLESANIKDSTGHDGKANFRRAMFGSVARQKSEPFTWSGVASSDV